MNNSSCIFHYRHALQSVGPFAYFTSKIFLFDFLVVLVSIIELLVASTGITSVFRAMRILRLFRLVRSWGSFRILIAAVGASIEQVGMCYKSIPNFLFNLLLSQYLSTALLLVNAMILMSATLVTSSWEPVNQEAIM